MIIFPAIDLMDGRVVRLQQGKAENKTIYPLAPAEAALEWQTLGAGFLHIVDLDGAFTGEAKNLGAVASITARLSIPCQLGGGMRDLTSIEKALRAGVRRVILGSKACQNPAFVGEAVREFGGEKIVVGIDAKDGKAAIQGWTEATDWSALDLARAVADLGVQTIIYTDIATDGMLQGPNLPAMREMRAAIGCGLIASGGVSVLSDITALAAIPGLTGVIVGKALYDKRFTLPDALAAAR
jgi:phosphoribosylformimino-5-aminoimidazole carboxamide ribotide isomerase